MVGYKYILLSLCVLTCVHAARVDSYIPSWYWWRQNGNVASGVDDYSNIKQGYLSFMFLGNGRKATQWYDAIENTKPFDLTFHDIEASMPIINNMNHQNIKTLLAIGGWTHEARAFPDLIVNTHNTNIFIESSKRVLEDTNASGLDFDWEYPGDESRGGKITDNIAYPIFLQNVRNQLSNHIPNYIQHVTVGINPTIGYDIDAIVAVSDRVNLMTYDMYGNWDQRLYYNSPWVNDMETIGFSIKEAIDLWTRNNTKHQNKLAIGYTSYGRGQECDIGKCTAQEIGYATSFISPLSKEAGVIDYQELLYMLDNELVFLINAKYNTKVDSVEVELLLPNRDRHYWLAIDDSSTICRKAQKVRTIFGINKGFMWNFYGDSNNTLHDALALGLDESVYKCPDMSVDDSGTYSIYPEFPPFLSKYKLDSGCHDLLVDMDVCFNGKRCPEAYYYNPDAICEDDNEPGNSLGDCSNIESNCHFVPVINENQYIWCDGNKEHLMSCSPGLVFNIDICGCDWSN